MGLFYSIENFDKINVIGKIYKVNLKLQAFAGETGPDCLFIEPGEPFILLGKGLSPDEKKILYQGKICWIVNFAFSEKDCRLQIIE